MATLTTLELMQRVPFFEHLTDAQAGSIVDELEKRSFKRAENLVVAGEKSNVLFVILSGTANVSINHSDGRKLVLATLEAGDCIGEMSLIDGEPHSANVIATKNVDVLTLTRQGFNFCMLNNPQMALAVMHGIVGRLRKADQKIASLALFGVFDRVAHFLREMAVGEVEGKLLVKRLGFPTA